jgi:cell division protease FtsH
MSSDPVKEVTYSTFYDSFQQGDVYELVLGEPDWQYRIASDKGKTLFKTKSALTPGDLSIFRSKIIDVIDPKKPDVHLTAMRIEVKPKFDSTWIVAAFVQFLPLVLLIVLGFYFIQKMQGGGAKAMSFGKSKARFLDTANSKTTFADVAGCDEAKSDLQEIVQFLKSPGKFKDIGARIPKGVLLMGPPGTGKTLLARAVAGEASVPFLHISGSDFVEMFVGVGASRVRDLFEQGKKHAPCLLFIDEIDAVGRQRGAGLGGGHDEREQTLNQLLVEMDGFDANEGVILIAATNRPDVLDPALMRPGRFDRQVIVDLPDVVGREGIFKVHISNVPYNKETLDINKLARATPGFSGADIANMVNEAALLAARLDCKEVTLEHLENARDKILMGPERKSRLLTDAIKERIAFHEAGHALISKFIPGLDPVHKVSVIPRGRALGVTSFLPEEDKMFIREKQYLLDSICGLFGGRVAEELTFNEVSTGASNDIVRATRLAHQMVCEYGMSDKLGPLSYGEEKGLVFLGREMSRDRDYSESTATAIDAEVSNIILSSLERTRALLKDRYSELKMVAEALLIHEVLDGSELDRLLKGEKLDPPVKEEIPADKSVGDDKPLAGDKSVADDKPVEDDNSAVEVDKSLKDDNTSGDSK